MTKRLLTLGLCAWTLFGVPAGAVAQPYGLVPVDSIGNYTGGGGGLPSGMVAFFAGACPSGWTEYTAARGRLVVGLPLSGTAEGTVGTALTNLQDKPLSLTHSGTAVADHASHTHTYTDVISHNHTQDAHTHTQNSHNHTQDAHSHVYASQTATTGGASSYEHGAIDTSSTAAEASISTNTTVATNQAATATNQNATATNQASGIATGTTAGPSATLTHGVTQPNAHTVNSSDVLAYIQLRACITN